MLMELNGQVSHLPRPSHFTQRKALPPYLDARPQSLSLQTDPGRAGMPQAPSTQLRTSSEVKCRKDKHLSFLMDSVTQLLWTLKGS